MNHDRTVKRFLRALESGRMDLETLKESTINILDGKGETEEFKKKAQAAAEAYRIYSEKHNLQEIPASPKGEGAILDFQGYGGKEVIGPNR